MVRRRKLKDYMGFSLNVINGYRYVAVKEDAPPVERRDECLTLRANSLRTLKKMIRIYVESGIVHKEKEVNEMEVWIVAVCNSAADGVCIQKAYGEEGQIKKTLIGMLLEDRESDPGAYDYGTETVDDIVSEGKTLNAYATYSDYHIDYTAVRLCDVDGVADYNY